MVVAAGFRLFVLLVDLRVGGAPELAAPDHQGVLEEPALFEIGEERCARAIGVCTECPVSAVVVRVAVPRLLILGIHVVDLDETHPGLGEPAGQQARLPEQAAAIAVAHGLWLTPDIEGFGSLGLHGECELHALDLGLQFPFLLAAVGVQPVEGSQQVILASLLRPLQGRVAQVGDEFVDRELVGIDGGGLVFAG